jgi:hypothetical protein
VARVKGHRDFIWNCGAKLLHNYPIERPRKRWLDSIETDAREVNSEDMYRHGIVFSCGLLYYC